MKKTALFAAGIAAALALTVTATNSRETNASGEDAGPSIYGVKIGNPINPATWWDGSEGTEHAAMGVKVNPMDPTFWMSFIDPKTHSTMHHAFTNPATYAQFTEVKTYTNMMDFDAVKKWVQPGTYAVLIDPQTYAYWMQPGAYTHIVKPSNYASLIDVSAYREVFDATLEMPGVSQATVLVKSLFN